MVKIMTRKLLMKQLAILWLAASLAGGVSADTELNGLVRYFDGVAAYEAEDYALALSKFHEAAEAGIAYAQNNLGVMYQNGQGVPQNHTEAVKWYRMAAEQGAAEAQSNLGFMYSNGQGVPQNHVMAYVWESVAAAQGNETAKKNRDISVKQLTPEQIARGQEIAARCFKSEYNDCD